MFWGSENKPVVSANPLAKTSLRDEVYSFKAQWFDPHAQLLRPYKVMYFPSNHMIEIGDSKTNKLFLKKTACPSDLTAKDFFLGAKVLLYGRNFELLEYLDEYTRSRLDVTRQRTLVVVHGSILASKALGKVMDSFYRNGFMISNARMIQLTTESASQLYEKHQGASFFRNILESVCAQPIVALEIVGNDSIEKVKQIVGALRARYGSNHDIVDTIEAAESTLEVQARQKILFESTGGRTATFQNCTCCVVQPHAVKEGKSGQIIDAILTEGYKITALQMFQLDRTSAAEFLEVYDGVVPHFNDAVDQFTTGPCIALEIQKEGDAVNAFRQTAGPWDIEMAKELQPGTIRAKFGVDRVKNAIHCTDLPEDGELESQYFFDILARK